MIVFNFRAISLPLRNFARRHKWRLRPLKRTVLPARSVKRALKRLVVTPPRIEHSTLVYATAHPEISVREIHPAEAVFFPHFPFLNNAEAAEEKSQPAFVFEIPAIDFWANYGGAIVTSDNALLADVSPEVWGAANHPIFSRLRLPKPQLLEGRTGIAVTPEANGNYYHWMLDALPRLLLLRHATGNFTNYDAVLLNGSRAPYEAQSLAAVGLPAEKIRYVDSGDRFQIASALVPSMDHGAKVIAPWKAAAMRELITHDAAVADRRLYISRRRAPVRRIANEDEVAGLLRAHGFEVLELEDYSWREQALMFAAARTIIAPHGAALANVLFCRPGAQLVEISTRAGYRAWYLHLAAAAQLKYHCIEAASITRSSSQHHADENDDMVVSVKKLEEFLSAL